MPCFEQAPRLNQRFDALCIALGSHGRLGRTLDHAEDRAARDQHRRVGIVLVSPLIGLLAMISMPPGFYGYEHD